MEILTDVKFIVPYNNVEINSNSVWVWSLGRRWLWFRVDYSFSEMELQEDDYVSVAVTGFCLLWESEVVWKNVKVKVRVPFFLKFLHSSLLFSHANVFYIVCVCYANSSIHRVFIARIIADFLIFWNITRSIPSFVSTRLVKTNETTVLQYKRYVTI